jgi:hypothetical protein
MRTLSESQILAVGRYARAFEDAQSETHAPTRIRGGERLRSSRAVLTQQERAILDMMAGRGRRLADLADLTGRSTDELWALYAGAASKLALHFEAVAETSS